MTVPVDPPPHLAAVRSLVREVDDIATRFDLGASSAALCRHAGELDTTTTPVVVIAGETKRGKSRLVNELLGVTGLSPVDVSVATALWVRFESGASAARILFADETACDMPIEEAQRWMGVASRPASPAPPIGAIVRSLSPLLDHVTPVDTPGVGGLAASHRAITLAALQTTTALLFVTDATAPISQVELQFLADATEQLSEVLFILTKVDLEPGWRQVLAENERLVMRTAPWLAGASWLPVSSVRHERARAMSDVADGAERDRATRLARDSGIGDVRDWLVTLARDRAGITKARNVVRHAESTLHRVDSLLAGRLEAFTDDSAAERVRDRLLATWSAVERQLASWREAIPRELLRVKGHAASEVSDEVARICATTLDRVDRLESGWRDEAGEFEETVATALGVVLQRFSNDAHDVIGSIVGERATADPSFHLAIADARNASLNTSRRPRFESGDRSPNGFATADVVELFGNTQSISDATRLVGTFLSPLVVSRELLRGSADLLFPGLGVLIGLGLAVAHHRARERARDQEEMREQIRQNANNIRHWMLHDLDVRHAQMNQALGAGSEAWARQRLAEIDVSLDRAARARAARQEEIEAEATALERDRSALAAVLGKAAALQQALAMPADPSMR